MKKTLSITIGGMVYNIEEDAYHVLDAYLNGIKAHFSGDENVDELIADIEASISEKFAVVLQKRAAIGLADVEEVVAIMGKINEIDDSATAVADDAQQEKPKEQAKQEEPVEKRLYRDSEDVVIGGVCSGLAAYFGVDVAFVRIAFIILGLINGIGFFLYLILWAAMPEAVTPSQKLAMRGRPVNVNELQVAIKEKAKTMTEDGKAAIHRIQSNSSIWSKIAAVPVAIVGFIAKGFLALMRFIAPLFVGLVGFIVTTGSFVLIAVLTVAAGILLFNLDASQVYSDLPLKELAGNPAYYAGIVSGFFTALIPLVITLMVGLSFSLRRNVFSLALGAIMGAIWIAALTVFVVSGVQLSPWINEKVQVAETVTSAEKTYDLKDFQHIHIEDIGRVTVKQGPEFSVVFTGHEDAIDRTEISVTNGVLTIATQPPERKLFCFFCSAKVARGEITLPTLASYEGSDVSRAQLEGFVGDLNITLNDVAKLEAHDLKAGAIDIVLNDVSRAVLDGEAVSLKAVLHDVSRLMAEDLKVGVTQIKTNDVSRAEIYATTTTQ